MLIIPIKTVIALRLCFLLDVFYFHNIRFALNTNLIFVWRNIKADFTERSADNDEHFLGLRTTSVLHKNNSIFLSMKLLIRSV